MARGGWNPALLRRIIGESLGREGPTDALRRFREAGGGIRTQTWHRLWGQAENERTLGGIEQGSDLRYKPTGIEILPMTTVRASGYMQRINIFSENVKGQVVTKTIDIKTDELRSRAWAIRQAERIAMGIEGGEGANPDTVIKRVLGGMYMGTYSLTPA